MTPVEIVAAVESGQTLPHGVLDQLNSAQRAEAIDRLLSSPGGRRWLRGYPHPDSGLPDRLLAYTDDFRQKRRDVSLAAVVERASEEALIRHASAVAAGPAGLALWARFRHEPDTIVRVAEDTVGGRDQDAAEATLYHLVLDPLDPYGLGPARRGAIASAALQSSHPTVRGLAAEHLANSDPRQLMESFDTLIHDEDQRVRGITWNAALRLDRAFARDRAFELIGDESASVPARRSALIAIGTFLSTSEVADVLAFLVVHPDPQLASDAADLLYNQHRNPVTAEAARLSPHEHVRQIAETLLDPLRGSPAAGGSRPGDPTRSTDIYAGMIRQLEEKQEQLQREREQEG